MFMRSCDLHLLLGFLSWEGGGFKETFSRSNGHRSAVGVGIDVHLGILLRHGVLLSGIVRELWGSIPLTMGLQATDPG